MAVLTAERARVAARIKDMGESEEVKRRMTSVHRRGPQTRGLREEGYLRDSDAHLSLSISTMSFVKLSIFGTSFEVRPSQSQPLIHPRFTPIQKVTTRYVDLQPVGMGALPPSLHLQPARSPTAPRGFRPRLVLFFLTRRFSHIAHARPVLQRTN